MVQEAIEQNIMQRVCISPITKMIWIRFYYLQHRKEEKVQITVLSKRDSDSCSILKEMFDSTN